MLCLRCSVRPAVLAAAGCCAPFHLLNFVAYPHLKYISTAGPKANPQSESYILLDCFMFLSSKAESWHQNRLAITSPLKNLSIFQGKY